MTLILATFRRVRNMRRAGLRFWGLRQERARIDRLMGESAADDVATEADDSQPEAGRTADSAR